MATPQAPRCIWCQRHITAQEWERHGCLGLRDGFPAFFHDVPDAQLEQLPGWALLQGLEAKEKETV